MSCSFMYEAALLGLILILFYPGNTPTPSWRLWQLLFSASTVSHADHMLFNLVSTSDIAADCCCFNIWHCCWLLLFQHLTLLLTAVISVSDIVADCCGFSVWKVSLTAVVSISDIVNECCDFSVWHCCWQLWFQYLTFLLNAVILMSDIAADCCCFSVWHCCWLL